MSALIVAAVRRRSFARRTVVELRADEPPGAGMELAVVADGLAVSNSRIPDLARVDAVAVDLPSDRPDDLYVWAHRPTRDGATAPMPVETQIDGARLTLRVRAGS